MEYRVQQTVHGKTNEQLAMSMKKKTAKYAKTRKRRE
jgi:hypothetical protein